MKAVLTVVAIVVMTAALTGALAIGIGRHEKAECLEWQEQGRQHAAQLRKAMQDDDGGFFAGWQHEQCAARGIEL